MSLLSVCWCTLQYLLQNCSWLINFLGTNLSNVPFHGGKGQVISYSGHFKLLLIILLKVFSQLSLLNFQVLGKPGYPSLPIPVVLWRCFMHLFPCFSQEIWGKTSRFTLSSIKPLHGLFFCLPCKEQTAEAVFEITAALWACQHKMAYTLHTSDKHDGYWKAKGFFVYWFHAVPLQNSLTGVV